jgi:hypothetical protein
MSSSVRSVSVPLDCAATQSARAAGGGGWPLSGGCRGPEARGGAQRAREGAPEAARPPAPAFGSRAADFTQALGRALEGPAETPASGSGRHAPSEVLSSSLVVRLVASVGLVGGLAGDAQGVADLGPGSALAAGGDGQEVARICQRVLGVSHRFQGVQGPLGTSQRRSQPVEHPADPPTRVAGFFGAHVNGYCRQAPTTTTPSASSHVYPGTCNRAFLNSRLMRVASSLFDVSGFPYRPTTEKKRPRAAPTAGVMDDIRGN